MKKVFSVSVDGVATIQQRDAFTNALQENKSVGFWHHLSHFWLIVDPAGTFTAATLYTLVHSHMPNVPVMITEGPPLDYKAFADNSGHSWLHEFVAPRKQT